MSNPTSAPFETSTPNDHSASVSVVNCILIIFSGIVVIARGVTRLRITRLSALDDVAIIVALVFAIAQAVTTQLATNHGLGKHRNKLSAHDFLEYSKFNYASQLLTIFTLLFVKLSVSQLILTIRPKRYVRLLCHGLDAVIVLWSITSIFALAFQCDLPRPWLQGTGRCVNLKALYYYVDIMNILTDVALVILPVLVVWGLQLKAEKKLFVVGLFATRIIVPGIVIAQLITLNPFFDALDGDQTWKNTVPTLLNQVMINVSIITACIPSLRRVVTDLQTRQTGLKVSENLELTFGSDLRTGKEGTTANGGDRSELRSNRVIPYGHNVDNNRIGNMASIYSMRPDREKLRSRQSSEEHLREESNIHYTVEVSVEEDDSHSVPSQRRHDASFP